jgi:hypothetical protein
MEAETTKSEKIADRPHRTTVVLSLFAVVVAIGSACAPQKFRKAGTDARESH